MAYLDSHGLQTLFTKLKTTFAKNIGITTGDSKVTVQIKDGAATPNVLASADIDAATTSAAGVMSKSDKSKLDGIEAGANNYVHPTTAGNKHVPAGGSSGQILGYDSAGTAKWIDAQETGVTKVEAGANVQVSPGTGTGVVTVSATDTTYVFNTAYNASTNKAATMTDVLNATSGAVMYQGTLASKNAFEALTGYKKGYYWIVSTAFTTTGGVTLEVGNMVIAHADFSSAFSEANFDFIQGDIEAIPDSEINALS